MTQSIILYNICEQHAWYSKICCYLYPFRRYIQFVAVHGIKCIPGSEQLRSGALHPSPMSAQRQPRLAGTSRNICLLSTARQLALPLAFGVVRAKLLLYLNNTAPARTCLQLLLVCPRPNSLPLISFGDNTESINALSTTLHSTILTHAYLYT